MSAFIKCIRLCSMTTKSCSSRLKILSSLSVSRVRSGRNVTAPWNMFVFFTQSHISPFNHKIFKQRNVHSLNAFLFAGFLNLFSLNKEDEKESLFAGFLNLFSLKEDEKESELITTIKRSILLIQKEEFKKAEQMLHLALKLAQQQQNDQAVTYIHDLMANLAYDTEDFSKAETLFVNVLQRLIASGAQQDDNRVLHISYKMADIYKKMGNIEKAEQGFLFCTERLENKLRVSPDEDTTLLLAMTLDAHARLLLDTRRLDQAFTCYQRAYFLAGDTHEQTAVLLNDLGTVSFLRGDHDSALMYLNRAVEVGDQQHLAAVYVNMGSLYLQKQMVDEAKRSCELGWSSANKHGDKEAMDEASLCLQEVKRLMQNKSRH